MAASDKVLKRAYTISLPGATKSIEQAKQLEAAFEAVRKKKLELNGQLNAPTGEKNAVVIAELRKQITSLEAEMKKLAKQQADSGKEALNQARAEQALANARAADARATAEQARAERERTTASIAQEKELDRLIDREEKQAAALERQRQKVQAASGSYNALYQEYKELYSLMKATPEGTAVNFRGKSLGFDEAIAKLKELATAEQDFRRQFSRDGLLVSEYTSGIIQAFKAAGLDDLIAGQISRGEQELEKLNQEFEQTRQQLSAIRVTGQGSLEATERLLIENRQRAAELERELGSMRNEFRGIGDVSNQVSNSLSRGFKQIGSDIRQFVLGFVGFQALLATTQQVFGDTVKLDSYGSAMKFVSGSTEELARNQQFLSELTDRLGLRVLDTTQIFKNFYAASTQAGIGADETRNIFAAATAAAANLKLSQEDTNGVLLAFGQIASKGKVQAEELRGQIGERLPGAFAVAARAMGVTQADLNKMLEKGEVVSSEFLPKFAKELQKTFGGDSTARVEGLQASINRLRNQFTLMIAENQEGLSNVLSGFIKAGGVLLSTIGLLTGNLPVLITLLSAYTAVQLVANAATLRANATKVINNLLFKAEYAWLVIVETWNKAYALSLTLVTGATSRTTAATALWNTILRANPLGIILTLLTLVAAATAVFASATTGSTEKLKEHARQLQIENEVIGRSTEGLSNQISVIDSWKKVLESTTTSIDTKKLAVQKLTEIDSRFSDVLKKNTIDLYALRKAYQDVTNEIRLNAQVQASASLSAERQKPVLAAAGLRQQIEIQTAQKPNGTVSLQKMSEIERTMLNETLGINLKEGEKFEFHPDAAKSILGKLQAAEDNYTATYSKYLEYQGKKQVELDKIQKQKDETERKRLEDQLRHAATTKDLKARIKQLEDESETLVIGSPERNKKRAELEALQKRLKEANGKEEDSYSGAKLTGGQRDAQRDADAAMEGLLRKENDRFEELKKKQVLTEQDEIDHENNLFKIKQYAYNKRIEQLGKNNAAERKAVSDLEDKKAAAAKEAVQKIYEIREAAAKHAFDQAKSDADNELAAVQNSNADDVARAQAQVDYVKKTQAATETYYAALKTAAGENATQIDQIEKEKANALRDINRDLNKDLRELQQARYDYEMKKIDDARNAYELYLRKKTAEERLAILNDKEQTPKQKQRSLDQLEDNAEVTRLSNQIALNDKEMLLVARKYKYFGFLSNEYRELETRNAELIAERRKKLNEMESKYATGAWDFRKQSLASYLETKLNLSDDMKKALQGTEQIAQQMLSNYFQIENDRVEQKKTATLERLDLEKQELLGNAQSNAERAAIEKQYNQKKKQAEREAAKERQALALQQLEVESAIGIAKTLATMAFPANLILAGAETLLFLQQRKRILSQKFEMGGMPQYGGDIGGQSHSRGGTPFTFGGTPYEAETKEIAIINRRSALMSQRLTVSGTPRQIASAINEVGGGIRFAPGAAVRRYEYGGMLQAPNFSLARSNSGGAGADFTAVMDALTAQSNAIAVQSNAIAATAGRIDQFEVTLVTSSVTGAQNKEVKNQSLSTF